MTKKIILVDLPLTSEEQAGSLKNVVNVMPSLGIGYIAALLEKNNFNVKIIDCKPFNLNLNNLIEILVKEKPNIIGLTATVLSIQRAKEASFLIKKQIPNILLIIGGPHITSAPEESMANSAFDIGVMGEGEFTLLEIIEQLKENNLNLDLIKGIIYRKNNEFKITEQRAYIQNLDELPFPARHLFPPLLNYKPTPGSYKKLPLAHLITSRGCPNQCIFCDRKIFGNRFRARSAKNVVDEIEELIKVHGAKEIKFFDDTFTLSRQRVLDIFEEMKKRNLKFPWSCLTRVDSVDKGLLMEMKKAGCWQILYGLESGDSEMLKRMKKGITLEQSERAIKWTKKAGINIRATFVLGMPGETMESIRKTIDFAKKLPIDVVTFYTLALYPGNELYEIIRNEGKLIHDDYSQYNPIIDVDKTRLAYVPEGMTEKQLRKEVARAHKEFYFRPLYITKQVFAIRSFEDIIRYLRAFKSILRM